MVEKKLKKDEVLSSKIGWVIKNLKSFNLYYFTKKTMNNNKIFKKLRKFS